MPEVTILVKAKDEASKVLGGIGGSLKGLGTVAAGAALGVGAAMVGVGAAAAKLAIDAAPIEGIKQSFEGLVESSGESADAMLAALKEGSAGMITQRDLMISYNQAAQLVGTTFANELPEAMGYLSKVAAATGQDMSYMMNSLVIGVGRESKMILDNLGITVDLEQAYDDWAASLGITSDELSDDQKKAALMNQVLEKLRENTAAMPEVTELASTKMAAFTTSIQDLKDRLGVALLPILKTFMDRVLTKLVDKLEEVMPKVENLIGVFSDFASELLSGDMDKAIAFLENEVWEVLEDVFGKKIADKIVAFGKSAIGFFTKTLVPAIQTAIPIIQNIGRFLLDLAETILPIVQGAFQFVMDHWQLFAIAAAIVGGVILALTHPITLIIGVIALLATAWANNWGGIQDKVHAVWEFIRPILETLWGALQHAWQVILPALQTAWQNAWEFIKGALSAAWEILRPKLEELWVALQWFWQEMKPRLEEAWAAAQTAMQTVKDWIVKELLPKLEDLWNWISENIIPVVGELAAKFLEFTSGAAVLAIKLFLARLIELWDLVWGAIKTVIEWIGKIRDKIREFTNSPIVTGILNLLQDIADAFEAIADAIRSAINAFNDFMNSGAANWSEPGWAGGEGPQGPSVQTGLNYVPFSPFPAVLHRGEAVLPAPEAERWRQGRGGSAVASTVTINFSNVFGVDGVEEAVNEAIYTQARSVL